MPSLHAGHETIDQEDHPSGLNHFMPGFLKLLIIILKLSINSRKVRRRITGCVFINIFEENG